jgi:hypothetical protein
VFLFFKKKSCGEQMQLPFFHVFGMEQNYKLLNLKFNTHLGNIKLALIKRKNSSFVKSHGPLPFKKIN